MDVEVIRSPRRRRTVQAQVVGNVLRLSIPATMTRAEEQHWIEEMTRRLSRQPGTSDRELARRAAALADRYRLPQPGSVRWVDNQHRRWGSCTPADRAIRISSHLAGFPPWVVDYVLVHELAHLVEPGHGPRFKRLVDRYPKAERAIGYLMAKGMDAEDDLRPPPRVNGNGTGHRSNGNGHRKARQAERLPGF